MRALTSEEIAEMREGHRKATVGERGRQVYPDDSVSDETEENGSRHLTPEEYATITAGLPLKADRIHLVILHFPEEIPVGAKFSLTAPDGSDLPFGMMVGMEWPWYDLELSRNDFFERYVEPGVVPLMEALKATRAAGVKTLAELEAKNKAAGG